MDDNEWLADRFEEQRAHLRAVAYRMLGSLSAADDAVQDTWVRFSRSGAADVENLGGWLTTIVSRVCLNVLRSRDVRREDPVGAQLPDLVVTPAAEYQPEHEAMLADSVSLALLVVLDTLNPAERLAFVLHDMFELSFEEIAPVVGRTPVAARQLASRARRRVRRRPLYRPATQTCPDNERWWRRSSSRHVAAISMRFWRCSRPTWCCGLTGARRRTAQ